MLTNMAWRTELNPNALWVQILKGIYHPNIDFLQVRRWPKPLWGWSNIMFVWDVLKEHGLWTIDNREHVNVHNDPWVPNLSNYRLLSTHHETQPRDIKVASLIHQDGRNISSIKPLHELNWPTYTKFAFDLIGTKTRSYDPIMSSEKQTPRSCESLHEIVNPSTMNNSPID